MSLIVSPPCFPGGLWIKPTGGKSHTFVQLHHVKIVYFEFSVQEAKQKALSDGVALNAIAYGLVKASLVK